MTDEEVRQITSQARRWLFAAEQDNHPGVRALHYDYAVEDMQILLRYVGAERVQAVTGVNLVDLLNQAQYGQHVIQRYAMQLIDRGMQR